MLLKILECFFVVAGLLFVLSVVINKLFVSKIKDNMKSSAYVAAIGFFLGFYIIFGLLAGIFAHGLINKIIIILFAISPFIIGKVATYKYEKLYTTIQILCVLISVIYVILTM